MQMKRNDLIKELYDEAKAFVLNENEELDKSLVEKVSNLTSEDDVYEVTEVIAAIGDVFADYGNTNRAHEIYEQGFAMFFNEKDAEKELDGYCYMARCLTHLNDLEAIDYFKKALDYAEINFLSAVVRVNILLELANSCDSLWMETLDNTNIVEPAYTKETWEVLSLAQECYEEVLAITEKEGKVMSPEAYEAYEGLYWNCENRHQYEKALFCLDKLIEFYADSPESEKIFLYSRYASIYENLGNVKKAKEYNNLADSLCDGEVLYGG